MTKNCPKCLRGLDLSEFQSNRSKKDGLSTWCKQCNNEHNATYRKTEAGKEVGRKHSRNHYHKNQEKCNARTKLWVAAHPDMVRKQRAAYAASGRGKHLRLMAMFRYAIANPEKVAARYIVQLALRTGILIRPATCEMCDGSQKPQAHHEDYSKPLDVMWLCPKCHHKIHAK